ncbi:MULTISPECIES: hypothetical protein [Flavobacteriaceae]|uniref:hypothetical protein n=1 Tax=Flavobacteriaceae TaxID=49546 RepID=UPI00058FB193|nr:MULTISPECIES: hypothetical protein [Flavobacteriaceae]UPS92072.1 hypothetical protein GMA17_10220 [Bizionia sp. M204]
MTEKEKPYKVLKYPPAYLDGYLAINGCLSEYCIPIEFYKENGEKWVYGFQGEIEKGIEIIDLKDNRYFFISTKNELNTNYIVDVETINPIKEIDYVSEILKYKNKLILILSSNSIAIVNEPNDIEYIESLCWDGIRNNRIENGILKGQLYDWSNRDYGDKYNKTNYELDLETLIIKKGKDLLQKSDSIKKAEIKKTKVENRKWWELWKTE